nr:MFS transporter [Providencia sp. G1(2023)]
MNRHQSIALFVLLLAGFVTIFDLFVVNVAIVSIQQSLNANLTQITLIIVGYELAFGLLLITGGRLGDIYGKKSLYRVGMTLFTITSLLCALAPTASLLVTSRFLQGLSAALLFPQVYSSIRINFNEQTAKKAFGYLGMSLGLAAIAGQALGGWLITLDLFGLGWRTIFLVNLPIGAVAVFLSGFLLEGHRMKAKEQGMVHVQITHPITECLKLANEIQQKYQLTHCCVVPSGQLDTGSTLDMISVAGAELMEQLIEQDNPQVIGIGSGRTLRSIIDALPYLETPQHQCVSLIGAIARDSSATRYDIPLRFAEKLQCRHYILPAPLYADSPEDKAMWCQHRVYKEVTEKALNADITFIGIGEVGKGCPLNSEGFVTDEQLEMLLKKGVAAELLGHFIQANGERLSTALDDTHTSVPLFAPPNKPVIAFAFNICSFKYWFCYLINYNAILDPSLW